MPAVWFALKRSLRCKTEQRDVHDPNEETKKLGKISTKRSNAGRSGCSRSIANLKDVMIHGSKRHIDKPSICSPRSIGSSELLNPITHDVVLNNSNFSGVLKPKTFGRTGFHVGRGNKPGFLGSPVRRTASSLSQRSSGFCAVSARPRFSFGPDSNGPVFCHKCHEQFLRWEDVNEHHISEHAVTELADGDSSRKIVEIICRASTARQENPRDRIERILKVHNTQQTLSQFEEYREIVKIKASKLLKKHPRCLADGNELLRFHAAFLNCSLGTKGSSSLCSSEHCPVCRILRNGFSANKEQKGGGVGVFTASTSTRAFESMERGPEGGGLIRKGLIICRVIAGRVHRAVENVEELVGQTGFDSLAGKVGVHANIEELYLLSPRALLPCFVVVYKNS